MIEKQAPTLAQDWRSEEPLDDPAWETSGHYGANGKGEYDDEPINGGTTARSKTLKVEDWQSFSRLILPKREHVISPILPVKGLALLYAWRGIGKTYVGLGMAYAIATGIPFLKWQVNEPRKVVYIDGEMPAEELQDRVKRLAAAYPDHQPAPGHWQILSLDRQEVGVSLNLASASDQRLVEDAIGDAEVLFFDNRSTLIRDGRENDADSWDKMQEWLLRLRRAGKTVIVFDHAGKGGSLRGTSKREDVLDTVIHLKRPDDYEEEEGARFEVHLEKARGLYGPDAQSFEAKLETKDGADFWVVKSMEDLNEARVEEATKAGRTVREIAAELGIGKSTVSRIQAKLRERAGQRDRMQ